MAENWVLNASPLIVLARIGREGLLLSLADRVIVPRPVAEVIEAGPAQDPARQFIPHRYASWVRAHICPPGLADSTGAKQRTVGAGLGHVVGQSPARAAGITDDNS